MPQAEIELHAWHVHSATAETLSVLRALLSAQERARAAAFETAAQDRRYILARGGLRLVLGRYLALNPKTLELGATRDGKPVLLGEYSTLNFNLSHTTERAAVAISRVGAVGIDIEALDTTIDLEAAEAFLSAPELESARSRHRATLSQHLLEIWVKKEAILKAVGAGLTIDPRLFTITEAGVDFGCELPQLRRLGVAVQKNADHLMAIAADSMAWRALDGPITEHDLAHLAAQHAIPQRTRLTHLTSYAGAT